MRSANPAWMIEAELVPRRHRGPHDPARRRRHAPNTPVRPSPKHPAATPSTSPNPTPCANLMSRPCADSSPPSSSKDRPDMNNTTQPPHPARPCGHDHHRRRHRPRPRQPHRPGAPRPITDRTDPNPPSCSCTADGPTRPDGTPKSLICKAGYPVIAPANPLRGLESDSAYIRSILTTIEGPILLVGHSYGGAVISNAAVDVPTSKHSCTSPLSPQTPESRWCNSSR